MGAYADRREYFLARAKRLRPQLRVKERARELRKRIREAGRAPGSGCEICGCTFTRTPVFDHNHATGQFRGWLCDTCNRALGLLGDSPDIIRAALRYLDERGHYGTDTTS